ncbi:MAG: SoxR reducing system RseC family protein [Candidatus Omnitrophota bacterium]
MIEKGTVLEKKESKIIVKIERHSACGGCKACETNEKREMTLEIQDTLDAQKGDIVEIELDDFAILRGAVLIYGVPLLGLMTGVLAGKSIAEMAELPLSAELLSVLVGAAFLAVALIAVKIYGTRNKERYKPRAINIQKKGGAR